MYLHMYSPYLAAAATDSSFELSPYALNFTSCLTCIPVYSNYSIFISVSLTVLSFSEARVICFGNFLKRPKAYRYNLMSFHRLNIPISLAPGSKNRSTSIPEALLMPEVAFTLFNFKVLKCAVLKLCRSVNSYIRIQSCNHHLDRDDIQHSLLPHAPSQRPPPATILTSVIADHVCQAVF